MPKSHYPEVDQTETVFPPEEFVGQSFQARKTRRFTLFDLNKAEAARSTNRL
jgi:hypothetical protein